MGCNDEDETDGWGTGIISFCRMMEKFDIEFNLARL
jgi:hypothetical protein